MPSLTARRTALALAVALAFQRPVAHGHRIAAAFDVDHRRAVEMRGEALGIDRRRSDDDLEVAALLQQLLEVAEQEVDVEAALVRLVDEDGVVLRQPAVGLDLREQDAVGHELDRGLLADVLGEAHLVADRAAQLASAVPRRRDAPPRARRCGAAGCSRSCRRRRGPRRGRAWASAWSCPIRFRRRSPRPGARGSVRRCGRPRRRSAATDRPAPSAATPRALRAAPPTSTGPARMRPAPCRRRAFALQRDHRPCRRPRSRLSAPSIALRAWRTSAWRAASAAGRARRFSAPS